MTWLRFVLVGVPGGCDSCTHVCANSQWRSGGDASTRASQQVYVQRGRRWIHEYAPCAIWFASYCINYCVQRKETTLGTSSTHLPQNVWLDCERYKQICNSTITPLNLCRVLLGLVGNDTITIKLLLTECKNNLLKQPSS